MKEIQQKLKNLKLQYTDDDTVFFDDVAGREREKNWTLIGPISTSTFFFKSSHTLNILLSIREPFLWERRREKLMFFLQL